ncbi:MAG: J domain-containing protein [Caldimicrobium sp.]
MAWRKKWETLEQARKLLKLPRITTRKEIVERYHELAKEFHPDKGGSEEKMKALNEAYKLLIEYCDSYRIEFNRMDNTVDPTDFWFQHFGEDPLWAKTKVKEDFKKERS